MHRVDRQRAKWPHLPCVTSRRVLSEKPKTYRTWLAGAASEKLTFRLFYLDCPQSSVMTGKINLWGND
jgi:hypothetical protein